MEHVSALSLSVHFSRVKTQIHLYKVSFLHRLGYNDQYIFVYSYLSSLRHLYNLQPLIDNSSAASLRCLHFSCRLVLLEHSAGEGQRSTQVSFPSM